MTTIRLFGTASDSIVDGPGLRYAVYFQGCDHGCPGCHNPGSHDPSGGYEDTVDEIVSAVQSNPMTTGVTFTGGEPFDQPDALLELCERLQGCYSLWAYTGYTIEQLRSMGDRRIDSILDYLDVLVDGPYDKSQRSLSLPWRGSANQRVISLNEKDAPMMTNSLGYNEAVALRRVD